MLDLIINAGSVVMAAISHTLTCGVLSLGKGDAYAGGEAKSEAENPSRQIGRKRTASLRSRAELASF
jgi:hypothetical protein